MSVRKVAVGSAVVAQDEPGDAMFVIMNGRVKVVIFGESGLPTARSSYRAGKLHGLSSWYRPDGSLMRTAEHADGGAR